MSLITRCPACGTMFKVVPDQLRISDGWVRCGHCSEVFDARVHMQAEGTSVSGPDSQGDSRPESRIDSQPFGSSLVTEVGESALPSGGLDSVQLREQAEALREGPLDRPFVLDPVDDEPSRTSAMDSSLDSTNDDAADPLLHDLSFVRQARRKAFWASRPVRLVLGFLVLVLGALLAVQVAVHDRDRLAATEPRLQPWLAALCDVLDCRIAPPRQIESIAIDNSSFNKVRGDLYRLSVTLRNQAPMEVQMPALELTLTDAQDQPVLRRVLAPADLQPRRTVLAAGGDWTGSVALVVAANGAGSRIAGYRVLAFYP